MEKSETGSDRSDLSNDYDCEICDCPDCASNSVARVLDPQIPKEELRKKKKKHRKKASTSSGNKPPFVRPPKRAVKDRGDFLDDDDDTDFSIKSRPKFFGLRFWNSFLVFLLYFFLDLFWTYFELQASILVPKTNQSNHQVLDSVIQYENNYIRPQSARIPGSILKNNRKSPSNESSDYEGSNIQRKKVSFASPQSPLSTASSTKTVKLNRNAHSSKTKKLDQQGIYEEDDKDSPYFSRNNTGYYSPLSTGVSWLTAESSTPTTASTEVVHQSFVAIDDKKVETLRKILQIPNDSHKGWREGMPDPEEDSKAMKDLVQKLYKIEVKEKATKKRTKYYVYKLLLGHMVELLDDFAYLPCPPGYVIRCRVTRNKSGLFPQYFLYLQRVGEPDVLLMIARKSKSFFGSKYIICTDPADLSTESPHCLGILESNVKGSNFTLYPELDFDNSADSGSSANLKRDELLRISFESNPLGFRGPRKLKVDIPKMKSDYERVAINGSFKDVPNSILRLKNKHPEWNPETKSFILNFHNRVRMSSVKNFVLICPEMSGQDLFQFGRLDKNSFILDFHYPFCPLQAFSIGLSSFDVKWGYE